MFRISRLQVILPITFALLVACGGGGGGGDTGGAPVSDNSQPQGNNPVTENPPFPPPVGPDAPLTPSGNPSPAPPPAQPKAQLRLSWDFPLSRQDGELLSASDVVGHIIVYVSETSLEAGQHNLDSVPGLIGERIGSFDAFAAAGHDLGRFIYPADLPDLVASGAANTILVPAPQSNYRLEVLPGDTYYLAVGAYDWMGLYSALSETIEVSP